MGSKILVCGGGGFIGSHFVQRMIKGGSNDIVCVDINWKALCIGNLYYIVYYNFHKA